MSGTSTAVDLATITNEPVEFEIAGVRRKIRRLTLAEMWGVFQAKAKSQAIADAKAMADADGMTGAARTEFLLSALRGLSGPEFAESIVAYSRSVLGIGETLFAACRRDDPALTLEQAQAWVTPANMDDLLAITLYACGVEADETPGKKAKPRPATAAQRPGRASGPTRTGRG